MVPQFGSGKFTIMEKTADLTVVQKTITDTFHKEGKPQKVQLQKKLEKEELYQSKRTFKSVAELHKEWTEPPHTDVSWTWASTVIFLLSSRSWTTNKIRSILPGLKKKRSGLSQWSKVHFSEILYLIWKPGSQSLEEEWRGTQSKMLEVQCEVSTVCVDFELCHLLVLVQSALSKVSFYEKHVFSGLCIYKLVLPEPTNSKNEESKRVLHCLCSPPTTGLLQAVQIQLCVMIGDIREEGIHPRGEVGCVQR